MFEVVTQGFGSCISDKIPATSPNLHSLGQDVDNQGGTRAPEDLKATSIRLRLHYQSEISRMQSGPRRGLRYTARRLCHYKGYNAASLPNRSLLLIEGKRPLKLVACVGYPFMLVNDKRRDVQGHESRPNGSCVYPKPGNPPNGFPPVENLNCLCPPPPPLPCWKKNC